MRILKKRNGFTLVEMLLVIVILGVLAGMMMLSAGSATDEATRTACLADRRAVKSALNIYIAEYGTVDHYSDLQNLIENRHGTIDENGKCTGICPSGGTYTISMDANSNYTVVCSIKEHNDSRNVLSLGDSETISRIIAVIDVNKGTTGGNIDSDALTKGASNAPGLSTALADAGFDLKAMGAASWHIEGNKDNALFYWTNIDIGPAEYLGKDIPVIRYNADTKTYTVWTTTIIPNTLNSKTYNKFGSYKGYEPSTGKDGKNQGDQTYAGAVKYYNELAKSKGYEQMTLCIN